ncbi:MAG: hypothetical protein M1837_005837 [Sclerophora amabilis]|nr:MAG: hypothetical protein M1837_005837 [Sclerophora amabilis]
MSFGVGVGDAIAVSKLALKVKDKLKDSSGQHEAISTDVSSSRVILDDIAVTLSEQELTPQQEVELKKLINGCSDVLTELDRALEEYSGLSGSSESIRGRSKRVWDRLKWDQNDIRDFRSRITLNTAHLNAFNANLAIKQSQVIKHGVDRLNAHSDDKLRQAILEWLSPLDFATQHHDLIARKQHDTGLWLLESDQFRTWLSESKQILFCPGIPGAGKTMMVSIVVEYLCDKLQDRNIGIAYLYCNYNRQQEQGARDLIASVLKQLIQRQASVHEDVRSLYKSHFLAGIKPSYAELIKLLRSVMSKFSKTFLVIDALDECAGDNGCRTMLLSDLHLLQSQNDMSWLTTSRPVPQIAREVGGSMSLEIRASGEDVQRYLEGQMPRFPSFVSRRRDIQDEIIREIVNAVDGMFLLARFHMESLLDKTTPKAIKSALKKLPKGPDALAHVYKEVMERIKGQKPGFRELAEKVLCWVTYAKRPLTISELQYALAVEIGEPQLDKENLPEAEEMVSTCAGIVIIDQESNIIRLVHYTTQEYLENHIHGWIPNARTDIVVTCLTCLSFNILSPEGNCVTWKETQDELYHNVFLDYAAHHWGHHAFDIPNEPFQGLVMQFLQDEKKLSRATLLMRNVRYFFRMGLTQNWSAMQVAAYFGLCEILTDLLANGAAPDWKNCNHKNPLLLAAAYGHEDLVKLLIDHRDVVIDSKDLLGRTPLSLAAVGGHEGVVRLLIGQKDVVIDSKDLLGQTPLSIAAWNGHEGVVQLLIGQKDIATNSRDINGRTPLAFAADFGHEGVVRLLIGQKDIAINSKDINGRTPLALAAEHGHEGVVKMLIDRQDVILDSKDKSGFTPLLSAVTNGREAVFKLLIGLDDVAAGSIDNSGRSALSHAAKRGKREMVKLLLDQENVAVDSKDNRGRTPLSWAAQGGNEDVLKLLVDRDDVTVDSKDEEGRTPLSWAATAGNVAVVKVLLDLDDVAADSKDSKGRTPLSWAARQGFTEVVRILIDREDVEVDSKDNEGRSPLSWAGSECNEEVLKLLIDREDVAVDSKDVNGQTPLAHATRNCFSDKREKVVKLLVSRDDVAADSKDNMGRTPLSWAAFKGQNAMVKLLVNRDDVAADSKDNEGRTPLSWAASKGHYLLVKLLIGQGDVAADSKDKKGRTPLSWAAVQGHNEVVELLISRDDVAADSKDNEGRTPLSWAAFKGQNAMVKLLVSRDDVAADSKDNEGRTPLSWAASKGHNEGVELLISRDDVAADSKDNEGRTPLSWAASKGHYLLVKLLIGRGDVAADSKDNEGRTPLSWALEFHKARVRTLRDLEGIAKPSANDESQIRSLKQAVERQEAIVKLLVGRDDVSIDSEESKGRTPRRYIESEMGFDLEELLKDRTK